MNIADYPPELLRQLEKIDAVSDSLGRPIDPGIRLLVAVLWAHGFTTDNSCGGHEEYRNGGPFVRISSKKASVLELKLRVVQPGSKEYISTRNELRLSNIKECASLLGMLTQFYAIRDTSAYSRIILETIGIGSGWLTCQGSSVVDALENDEYRAVWLKGAQREFSAFTDFLIDALRRKS